jgi:hypothetical protein
VALSANPYGASRCGAAIYSIRIYSRGVAARNPATAVVNASGAADVAMHSSVCRSTRSVVDRRAASRSVGVAPWRE